MPVIQLLPNYANYPQFITNMQYSLNLFTGQHVDGNWSINLMSSSDHVV